MKITLYQVLSDEKIEASVSGDTITINGEAIDLSVIPDGYELPATAIDNPWFVAGSNVVRVDGQFEITLRFPVEWETPDEVRAPVKPIVLTVTNGRVPFPDVTPPPKEEISVEHRPESSNEKQDTGGLPEGSEGESSTAVSG